MLSIEKTLLPDVSAKVAVPVITPSTISASHWESSLGLAVPAPVVLASTEALSKNSDTEASSGGSSGG